MNAFRKYVVAGLISLIVVSPAFAGRRSRGGCSSGSCGSSAGFSSSCASGSCSSVESFSGSCSNGQCEVTQSSKTVQTTPMTAVPAGTKTVTYALLNGSWVIISTSEKGCPCPNCTGECVNCPNGKCSPDQKAKAAKEVHRVGSEHSSLPKSAYNLFSGSRQLELVRN